MEVCVINQCTGCGLCISLCTKNAISFHTESDWRTVAWIDESLCSHCGLCQKNCPQNNSFAGKYPSSVYASWVKNEKKRVNSASGGIGYALAENWILEGGVVFGAAWNDGKVEHIAVTRIDELWRISGSKYVQSDTTNAFRQIMKFIKEGKKVLFIGAPCQVDAVKKLIPDNSGALTTVDLVCHGTPPMKYLKEYLGEKLDEISYFGNRSQTNGYGLKIWRNNGIKSFIPQKNDDWTKAYKLDFTLRENCYQCRYARTERCGDITIGDYWGLNMNQMPSNSPKYISLVLINNSTGNRLWESIHDEIETYRRAMPEAFKQHGTLRRPTPIPRQRVIFLKNLESYGNFSQALQKTLSDDSQYVAPLFHSYAKKAKKYLRRILRKIASLFVPKPSAASENSVGIVTVERKYLLMNYGTLMQHYALRKVLCDGGYVPWRYESSEDLIGLFMAECRTKIKYLLFNKEQDVWLNIKFSHFLKKHFANILEPKQKDCNRFVVGSDQVWGGPTQQNTLGDLKGVVKVAYAVSADWKVLENSECCRFYMSEVLGDYRALSVREKKGIDFLQCVCPGKEIIRTIDPTFLLSTTDYNSIIPSARIFKKPTLFCYFVNIYDNTYMDFQKLESIANERRLSLVITGIQGAEKYIPKKYYRRLSPEDWLRAFRDASMIVTNSFHGTVFALVYNKSFIVIEQIERDGQNQNLRLHELAEMFNFKNKIISAESLSPDNENLQVSVKWNEINLKINEYSAYSRNWLLDVLAPPITNNM